MSHTNTVLKGAIEHLKSRGYDITMPSRSTFAGFYRGVKLHEMDAEQLICLAEINQFNHDQIHGDSEIIICDAGDYSDLDNTGIVVLQDDRRVAVFHHKEDAIHWARCVEACTDIPNPAAIADVIEALRELRDNIGAASLARNPHGIAVRKRADDALAKLAVQS